MNQVLEIFWVAIQILIGYNLVIPFLFLVAWFFSAKSRREECIDSKREIDFAIIVTAYQHTSMLSDVVGSIQQLKYGKYHVYIVADNCVDELLEFESAKVTVLRPEIVLASNTRSHLYAMERFIRHHDAITIIDSDNLVHPEFLRNMNRFFQLGYQAVQGIREPKNLDTTIACLDGARDIYYHFYDCKVLFQIGSSSTLAGSGMAFSASLYGNFLKSNSVVGAGFDKVLQAWLVSSNIKIAFSEDASVYDEKTSKTDQLVQQRSRWINSWFKYAFFGIKLLKKGIMGVNRHQILFGIVLLRPPLFIFLALSFVLMLTNLLLGSKMIFLVWLLALVLFSASFYAALAINKADKRIFRSLKNIPVFVFYQFVSLLNVRKANQISISTKHDRDNGRH